MAANGTNNTVEPEVWIGLVEMLPRPHTPSPLLVSGVGGAFCTMLAWGRSESDFRERVREALDYYHLDLGEADDVVPLRARLQKSSVHPVLLRKAREVEETGLVRFHEEIDTYPLDDSRESET